MVELELAKDYALRVKDMAAAEQANTAAAAHAAELKSQKQMLFDLRQETDVLLGERDKQLQQSREKHQVRSVITGEGCFLAQGPESNRVAVVSEQKEKRHRCCTCR